MRITDLLDKRSIQLSGNVSSKNEAIDAMVELMYTSGKISDKAAYKKGVYEREAEGTTGVGEGIAIPHCQSEAVKKPGLSAMVIKKGVDFDALDNEPVSLIFLIAAPKTADNIHVDVLSKLSEMLMDEKFTYDLRNAGSVEEFLQIIDRAETQKDVLEAKSNVAAKGGIKLLAVTGCPTGIAHTFMAAKSLEKKAEEMGCSIKVETRGSGGAKNVLTNAEIAEADCIIVAADTNVPMDRFHGKKVIQTKVADGIHKADKLIERAINGDAAVYKSSSGSVNRSNNEEKQSIGHQIYKHLMSGVSHMIPFVVGGGILIALAFLIDSLSVDINSLTSEMRSNFGSITPLAAMFKTIGGTAFSFMLPILAGFIALSIGDRPALALGFVGGMIASHGKSGFLGALVAGFLAGYIIVLLRKLFSKLPVSLEGLKPVLIYPLLGIFIVGVIMTYVVEPPVGFLNTLMNQGLTNMSGTSKIILGIVLGGMMSVDLGGPVNKAAYVFGTASIAAGNYDIMAALMVGGMVPPCLVALSTILFKNKFTEEERKSAPSNFVMGLSFISEGAIPFAAADPLRVLPSCIIGSAIAGALSMAFNCKLMAPHGGIFVFPVVQNALLYLVALVIGTVIGAIILGILKKPVENR
ncbi:MAG TPA: fructose-specific PTS transporter subunit EIIC [Mobilitalea sp.]|nr:fructose-specific PTS transporter subunit EIIC [Mobilitalea sp.]